MLSQNQTEISWILTLSSEGAELLSEPLAYGKQVPHLLARTFPCCLRRRVDGRERDRALPVAVSHQL